MPTVTKYASAHTAITTGYTNPTNAYADNNTYATAAPAKNSEISAYWGFPSFTTGDIPDGSTINSVLVEVGFFVSTAASVAEQYAQVYVNTSGVGSEQSDTTEPTTETILSHSVTTGVSLTDLRTADLVRCRTRSRRGNSGTAVTFSVDYVRVTVDYTEVTGVVYDSTLDDVIPQVNDGGFRRIFDLVISEYEISMWSSESHEYVPYVPGGDVVYTKTGQSALSVLDQITQFRRLNRTTASTITLVDERLARALRMRLSSDGAAIADAILSSTYRSRSRESAINLNDAAIQFALRRRDASSAIQLIDSYVKELISSGYFYVEVSDDTLDLYDNTLSALRLTRQSDDALLATDQSIRRMLRNRRVDDGATLTDAALRYFIRGRVADDALATADATARSLRLARRVDDAHAVVDAFIKNLISSGAFYVETSTDSIRVYDESRRQVFGVRVSGDSITVIDARIASAHVSRRIDEAVALIDALISSSRRNRTTTDHVSLMDQSFSATARNRLRDSLLTVTDSTTAVRMLQRAVSDALYLADNAIKEIFGTSLILALFSNDGVAVNDEWVRRARFFRYQDESVALVDLPTKSLRVLRQDAVALADQGLAYTYRGRVLDDHLPVSDNALAFALRFRAVAEVVSLTDQEAHFKLLVRDAVSLLGVSDLYDRVFISGLAGLLDVRVRIGTTLDKTRLGVYNTVRVGVDPDAVEIGAYN